MGARGSLIVMKEKCINPNQIKEHDLMDYVDGLAPIEVQNHVARCQACQTAVSHLREELALLYAAAYEYDCPTSDDLLLYQAGLLAAADHQRIETHLQDCKACQLHVQQLLDVPDESPTPRWLTDSIWERLRETGKQLWESVKLPAPMVPQPALVFRGGERIRETYEAGDYQIGIVKIMPIANENRWQLEGQIVNKVNPTEVLHGRIQLHTSDELIVSDIIDEFGYFALKELPSGNYTILLELEEGFIPIPDFTIP